MENTDSSVERPEGRNHLETSDIDRWKVLNFIFQKYGVNIWIEFNWLRKGSNGWLM
jgi:hypothetical protein